MPKSKQMFVRTIRPATENDLKKIESETARVPIYNASILDTITPDTDADTISGIMVKVQPKNTVEKAKVKDGFVSIFALVSKDTLEYTDYGGCDVTVLAVMDGQKATFEGRIIGTAGYVVFVESSGYVFMCPIQAGNCWIFA